MKTALTALVSSTLGALLALALTQPAQADIFKNYLDNHPGVQKERARYQQYKACRAKATNDVATYTCLELNPYWSLQ